jgi:outer membrane protein assembly factor BamB
LTHYYSRPLLYDSRKTAQNPYEERFLSESEPSDALKISAIDKHLTIKYIRPEKRKKEHMSKAHNALGRRAQCLLFIFVMGFSLLPIGCNNVYAPGETSPQSEQDNICNASLFETVRFSSSQQDGALLYASYPTDTSFTQQTVVAVNTTTQQHIWQRSFSVNAGGATRLTASDGIVYALFQSTNPDWSWMFALDAQTGQQLWQYHEQGDDDIAVCYGTVLLLSNWSLHSFDSKTGRLLWSYDQLAGNERLGSMLSLTKDTIYFASIALSHDPKLDQQATVHAFDLRNGKDRWKVQLQNKTTSQVTANEVSLTLTGSALYVLQSSLTNPGQLLALRPQDGGQIWSTTSQENQEILMATSERVYSASAWEVEAFRASDGKIVWSQHADGTANRFFGSAQHGIFEIQYASSFCSLDLSNGMTNWCLQLSLLEWDGTPFFVDQNTIYLFSDGNHNYPDDTHNLFVVDKQTGQVRKHLTIHTLAGAITAL